MQMVCLIQEQKMILVLHMNHYRTNQDLLKLNYFHELQFIEGFLPIKSSMTAYSKNSAFHTLTRP